MSKDKRTLLKFIKIARKNPENKLYLKFNAINILPIHKDWIWCYEQSKCDWIIAYIEWDKKITFRYIKRDFKKHINKVCFYDEFIDKAKQLIREYKR